MDGRRGDRHASWRFGLTLVLLLLACYAYFFPRWADWNQNSRLDLTMAIVDQHALTIDAYVANTGDYATYRGHTYSDKAPGMALLGVPVYAAFERSMPARLTKQLNAAATSNGALDATLQKSGTGLQGGKLLEFAALAVLTFVLGVLPSVALGSLVFAVAGQFGCSPRERFALAALYGLGTSAFPYANSLVGHQTSAFLLFAAFALLFAIRRQTLGRGWLPVAGLLLGYAAINEYQTVLIGGLLAIYALVALGRPGEVFLKLVAGGLPPLVLLLGYDLAAFGTVLPVGYLHSTLWSNVHKIGLISLTYPHADALWGITFGIHRGLFFLSPFLLLAIPGYVVLWQRRERHAEFWVLLLAPVAFLLFNGSSAMWDGGFAVGPRYLVPSLPFLGLVAGVGLTRLWRLPAARPVLFLMAGWSVVAVWAETIGGQSFPDYTANALVDYSVPRLVAGDIARNAGMLLRLHGWASLLPLLAVAVAALLVSGLVAVPRLPYRIERSGSARSVEKWA